MQWAELRKLKPLKINVGGRRDHHPRRRWRGYVSIDAQAGDGWSVQHQMPERFDLPDDCVDAALSEHFLEHLVTSEAIEVMAEVRRVLKPGAMFRVAVPDILHPRKRRCLDAREDLDDENHQSIWTYQTMVRGLLHAGFQRVDLQHYWDRQGGFHCATLDHQAGWVKRSPEHDKRNRQGREYQELWVTSLVVDAHKARQGESARAISPQQVEWYDHWHLGNSMETR